MIRVSQKTTNGVKLMFYLALDFQKKPVSIKEVAKKEDISARYLEQVIIPLKNAGLVSSTRGVKGGYFLTKPPSQIKISEIIRVLEGSWALVECVENPGYCSKADSCISYEIWEKATQALSKVFESYTLNDLVQKHKEISLKEMGKKQMNERWKAEFYKEGNFGE